MNLVEIVLVLYIINENVPFFLLFSEEKICVLYLESKHVQRCDKDARCPWQHLLLKEKHFERCRVLLISIPVIPNPKQIR